MTSSVLLKSDFFLFTLLNAFKFLRDHNNYHLQYPIGLHPVYVPYFYSDTTLLPYVGE